MSEKEQPPIMEQKLCVNGCGFFGSSSTSHMCSKCWKDTMSQRVLESDTKKEAVVPPSLPPMSKGAEEVTGTQQPPLQADAEVEVKALSTTSPFGTALPPELSSALTGPTQVMEMPAIAPAVPVHEASKTLVQPHVVVPPTPPAPVAEDLPAQASQVPVFGGKLEAGAAGAGLAAAAAAAAAAETTSPPEQKNRKRCFACSKKVGLTGIACRCNYVFCSLHRYPEQHDCTFDFKTADRSALKRTVVGGGQFSKVDRL